MSKIHEVFRARTIDGWKFGAGKPEGRFSWVTLKEELPDLPETFANTRLALVVKTDDQTWLFPGVPLLERGGKLFGPSSSAVDLPSVDLKLGHKRLEPRRDPIPKIGASFAVAFAVSAILEMGLPVRAFYFLGPILALPGLGVLALNLVGTTGEVCVQCFLLASGQPGIRRGFHLGMVRRR